MELWSLKYLFAEAIKLAKIIEKEIICSKMSADSIGAYRAYKYGDRERTSTHHIHNG